MGFEDIFYKRVVPKVSILADYYQHEPAACVCVLENLFTTEEVRHARDFARLIEFDKPLKVLKSPKLAERLERRLLPLAIVEAGKAVRFSGVLPDFPFYRVPNGVEPISPELCDCVIWSLEAENGCRLSIADSFSRLHVIKPNHALLVPKNVKAVFNPNPDKDQYFVIIKLGRSE